MCGNDLCNGKLVKRVPINGWKAGCLGSEELGGGSPENLENFQERVL